MFSKQKVFCQICGKEFETDFMSYDGRYCSEDCCDEFQWRKTLAIMGKAYYPDPRKLGDEKGVENA